MTDNSTGPSSAPSKEQMSSAEDFMNNGDLSQSPKLAEGFKDILDNKQNFNFEVKDIGGGQYQAKASSVYQQDDPNFQKAVSVDLNENDVKKLDNLNQDRVKAEASSSNTNTAEPNKPQSTQSNAEVKPEAKPAENKKEGGKPDPNADFKSRIEDLGKKREDFANKVKAIGSAENKGEAIKDAFKAGNKLRKEANQLDKDMKGKQSQKKGKSSSSSSEKDEDEEIGSLYAALMAIINGMKDLRKQVKDVAQKEKIDLPQSQPKMSQEDKQFMKAYPGQRQELQGKHQDTLKQMTDMDNKFKSDGDKLNKDFDKKIADERAKNEGDPSKVNALINQKNQANTQLYDNYIKDRGGLEKQADGLKDQTQKLDQKADKIQNSQQANKPGDFKSRIEDLGKKREDFANKVKAIGSAENKGEAIKDAFKAGNKLRKEANQLDKDMKGKQSQKKGKSSSSSSEKDEDEEIGSLYAALMAIINGMKDLRKQVKDVAQKEKVDLPKPNQPNSNGPGKAEGTTPQAQTPKAEPTDTKKALPEPPKPEANQKPSEPAQKSETKPSGPTEGQKDLAKNVAKDAVIETAKSGGQPEVGVAKAAVKNAPQMMEEGQKLAGQNASPSQGQGDTQEPSKKATKAEEPQAQTPNQKPKAGMSSLKSSKMDLNSNVQQNQPSAEQSKPQPGMSNVTSSKMDLKLDDKQNQPSPEKAKTGTDDSKKELGQKIAQDSVKETMQSGGQPEVGVAKAVAKNAGGIANEVKATAANSGGGAGPSMPEGNKPEPKSSGPSMPGGDATSKGSGLAASFQGVADKISQAGSSLKGGQGGDANDIGNGLSQAITQLTQGLTQLADMGKKLSSGGDDKKPEGPGGAAKPKASKGGGAKPEEDAVPGQEGQELADALKAIGDGIKEMGQTLSKMSGKDGAKEGGGKKPAKSGGGKEEGEEEKKLEPGDPSAAINAVVEGINDLIKQIGDLSKQLTAGAGMPGMEGPGGGAPKGPGGGSGADGGQSPGMDMKGMGGDAAGGMGAPPMPRDKDAFKNEDGKTKDTNEIGKEVGKDFAKEMSDPSNGGQPEIAAVKVLIKDGPALMEAAKSKMEEKALAPVGIAKDVASSMNSELEKAGNPTTQTYDPANQAAIEKSQSESKKGAEAKPEPKPEASEKSSPNKPKMGG